MKFQILFSEIKSVNAFSLEEISNGRMWDLCVQDGHRLILIKHS